MTHPTTPYRTFDQQTWPVPCTELDSVAHKLLYLGPDHILSADDRMIAVRVIDAYCALIATPKLYRNAIIKELRKGPNV